MPQAPSPNMGIIWPTDLSDADVWAPIMDTAVRAVIDSHDHSTGKGVKIPAAALDINADVSWSDSLGASHSITDLVSVDFKPSPAASVTGFAGAFFISDGTGGLSANELYFRTISGTNVKFTAGAALNVAAFTGGFGGDYAAAGALALFDDATDSYWFQQQVGAAVRQYARMRSADVDLYEFKANPAAGVPTNRVRLASPAALAGSYTLTFPGALPASLANLRVDNTGAITASLVTALPARTFSVGFGAISASAAAASMSSTGGIVLIALSTSTQQISLPLWMNVGETLSAWQVQLQKSSASGTISVQLQDLNALTATPTQIGATQSNSANNPGNIQLGQSGLSTVIAAGHTYQLIVNGGGVTGDFILGYSVTPT